MKYKGLVGAVAEILNREIEYLKSNFNPGIYVMKGGSRSVEEIEGYGGVIKKHDNIEQVRAYHQGDIKFDATFRKAPGGNPYWTIVDCGKTINGDPRKSVKGFELKRNVKNLETLVK